MMSNTSAVLSMLVSQFPLILAYLAGVILAIVVWDRHPRPAALVFTGSMLLLVTTVGYPFVYMVLIDTPSGPSSGKASSIQVMALLSSFLRAVGFAILLWAAFADRRAAEQMVGFPVARRAEAAMPPSLPQ